MVGDKRLSCYGFFVILLLVVLDRARVVELAPRESFDILLLLFLMTDELLVVVVLKNYEEVLFRYYNDDLIWVVFLILFLTPAPAVIVARPLKLLGLVCLGG